MKRNAKHVAGPIAIALAALAGACAQNQPRVAISTPPTSAMPLHVAQAADPGFAAQNQAGFTLGAGDRLGRTLFERQAASAEAPYYAAVDSD
ncbi:MAG: hypothetical protein AAGI53_11920 [Planctomycetota bacterium]